MDYKKMFVNIMFIMRKAREETIDKNKDFIAYINYMNGVEDTLFTILGLEDELLNATEQEGILSKYCGSSSTAEYLSKTPVRCNCCEE